MQGFELVKREDHWALYNEDGHKIAATIPGCNSKLSIKNCEAIANRYDLDELAENTYREYPTDLKDATYHYNRDYQVHKKRKAFIKGFQKAVEILGDKKFSEEHLKVAADWYYETKGKKSIDEYIQSLQQTEWDVEIVTEKFFEVKGNDGIVIRAEAMEEFGERNDYKLDADGCLVLKRK